MFGVSFGVGVDCLLVFAGWLALVFGFGLDSVFGFGVWLVCFGVMVVWLGSVCVVWLVLGFGGALRVVGFLVNFVLCADVI